MAVNRRDIFWGYTAQLLNVGAGLILLPVIVRYFSPEDVGLWFVFITLAGLAQLLEFGFQPTLARNTAYVYAGARSLEKNGLPDINANSNSIDIELLANLISASRKIYRIVSVFAVFILLGGGTFYIYSLLVPQQNVTVVLFAWVAFALGYIVTFYYGYFNGMLQGRGDITAANQVVAITRGSLIVIGTLTIIMGYGLLGLGVASLISCIIGRWLAIKLYYSQKNKELSDVKLIATDPNKLIKILWYNSSRLGAVQVGAFLIQRANILIASSFLGLAAAASYGMTLTVLMAIVNFSMVVCLIQLPTMNSLQAIGNKKKLRTTYGSIVVVGWVTFLLAFTVLFFGGNSLLNAISSKTLILPALPLFFLGLVMLLELNHSLAATYLTTINEIPFVRAALWSGVGIVLISLFFIKMWGIWALIAGQGLVQLAYNNWKWPALSVRSLGGDGAKIIMEGFLGVRNIVYSRRK